MVNPECQLEATRSSNVLCKVLELAGKERLQFPVRGEVEGGPQAMGVERS